MESAHHTDPYLDYSIQGLEISEGLSALGKQRAAGEVSGDDYATQLTGLAERSLSYLSEAMQRFSTDFMLDVEAESLAHAISGESRVDFAIKFNELLYASISDPAFPVDAISNKAKLQCVVDLTAIADRMNGGNFYERPNRVRELGDAIIGRAILTMLSFNMDPRSLRIPYRS